MKRILLITALVGLFLTAGGCSNGLFGGGLNGCNDGCGSSGLFSGSLLPSSDFLKDGPVRQWFRGDSCDSCNVPAGQISYDSGFDSSCESGLCGQGVTQGISAPFQSGPIISSPTSTGYYPSINESPINIGPGVGGINEGQFFGGSGLDSIELPPLHGN